MAVRAPAARPPAGGSPQGRRRAWKEGALGLGLVLPPLLVLVFLIVLPAANAIVDTLTPDPAVKGLTPMLYARLLGSRIVRSDIVFTVVVTLVSVAVTFGLSYPLALYLRFARGRLAA